jgi:hypothetical protein
VLLWIHNRTQLLFAGNLDIQKNDSYERDGKTGVLIVKNVSQEMAGDYTFVF